MLFAPIVFYCVITALMVTNNIFNVYILPYAMLPIIIRVFLDSRTAFPTHVITILICSITLRYPHEFIPTQIAAGLSYLQLERTVTTFAVVPHGPSGHTDVCSYLFRF